jgi:hypothetical protein
MEKTSAPATLLTDGETTNELSEPLLSNEGNASGANQENFDFYTKHGWTWALFNCGRLMVTATVNFMLIKFLSDGLAVKWTIISTIFQTILSTYSRVIVGYYRCVV